MFKEINGAHIFVNEQGEGEPILMLHGVPDSAEIWNPIIEELKGEYRCLAPDLPGFFRSGIPSDYKFELAHYGQFVNQLIESLEIDEPVTLMIHDWGGIFGMSFACQYPEKVKRIVGGSFPFSHLYKWHEWATVWRTPILGELSMALMNRWTFQMELKRGSRRLTTEQIDEAYFGRVTEKRARDTVLKLYRSATPRKFLAFQNRLERLAETVPISTVWGRQDPYVPFHFSNMMHARQQTVVDNCGHWVPMEAPKEYCAALAQTC